MENDESLVIIPPVEAVDFHYASVVMEKHFSPGTDKSFDLAQKEISKYCDDKFNVSADAQTDKGEAARDLSSALTARILCWAEFIRRNSILLQRRELMREGFAHNVLTEVAASVPLEIGKGFVPEDVIAEADRRL